MSKLDRESILQIAEQILNSKRHSNGDTCFLTVYQLAHIIDKRNPALKKDLPVGGKGDGYEHISGLSLAQHLSQFLARDGRFERQWFCIDGVDSFTICGKATPSNIFSMFRLRNNKD
ncbi:MAG: hypothetical protein LBC73_08765 [Oscillospiraceae bacterium]|jgi:hypothetical protein|nr:hypothetical protein [Oscillospiraceae bacterium]